MTATILLCFIHGFSGDDETFHKFPNHLRDAVEQSLPGCRVVSAVYPKHETKGDLPSCVARFREWFQQRVDELEAEARAKNDGASQPSSASEPSDEPLVQTVLLAHSMGGFVAADAVASIVNEQSNDDRKLPCIKGLLTFDTPFLGLANPMLAYSAFSQFSKVSSAYRLLSMLPGPFFGAKGGGGGGAGAGVTETASKRVPLELGALPAWRTIAAYTGTTGALAAAGIAAYTNREELYQGYTWLQNHMQFVGVILRRRECRLKLARLAALDGFGFANMYTSLGPHPAVIGGSYMPERTFCAVPPATNPLHPAFRKAVNLVAKDELDAHSGMFQEERNPGYSRLLDDTQQLADEWLKRPFHGYRTADLERKTTEAMANAEKATAAADAEQDLQAAALAAKTPLPVSDDSDLAQEAGAENDANGP